MTLIIILKDDTILKFTNVTQVVPLFKDGEFYGLIVTKPSLKFEFASNGINTFKCIHEWQNKNFFVD